MTASELAFCVHCGQEWPGGADHPACRIPGQDLQPPRFCGHCARRLVVQVTPLGWTARCSRHGDTASG
ncbi:hypothetical protein ACIOD2_26695 [Amycolatopsis sp. NPDC088138]|uniref:biotin synthase auxiliary protein BsaP n=1 Tax=Amycolatopsis sp. NPDC088138 TaxID=3363938 RepID=UPI003808E808